MKPVPPLRKTAAIMENISSIVIFFAFEPLG